MARPYFRAAIDELEQLFRANLHHLQVLEELRVELTYRETDAAKQLLREVRGVIEGRVPLPPKPPRVDDPGYQGDLF